MQFIANGPDIPNTLLQAHEEGRVVFFCGAGISYPAGLPSFDGLVEEIYRRVGTARNPIEEEAYSRSQYDATLDILERRLPGQRRAMRRALAEALSPQMEKVGAADNHLALLQLGRDREGALRLVTTNFDRIFEWVAERHGLAINAHAAPLLPVVKNSRWNGLVYLHGLLPADGDESALNRLVVTSGDFGLAYLAERWAARFVSALFGNYIVCFVGYSLNDPVLRYMMDALAADRMLGECALPAYAFADCKPGEEAQRTIEWEAKGVAPILYQVPARPDDHEALRLTLKDWAETYRDGILGREQIIVRHARAHPSASTPQDDFVGRILWALSDKSGLPAKRFAELDPVPPLEWLEELSRDRYQHGDLEAFGVPHRAQVDDKLRFSLIRRPTPYTHAPSMAFINRGAVDCDWDDVMFQLGRWLVRHLNDASLITRLANWGGHMHGRLKAMIEHHLDHITRLEQDGNTKELEDLRTKSPNAIPQPPMRKLWRLLLGGQVKSGDSSLALYRWKNRLERDGLTVTLRFQLRELLSPKVVLRKPINRQESGGDGGTSISQDRLVNVDLELAANHVHSWVDDIGKLEQWQSALPTLVEEFQRLLLDTLDLFSQLDKANEREDRSMLALPSISPHFQNKGLADWATLIELLRDSWLANRKIDPSRATVIAQQWFRFPYPTFKRLALFAASNDGCISGDEWVHWLTADGARWLWWVSTHRETMRLMVLQGAQLSPEARDKLESHILAGPPRSMYREDIEPARWQSLTDRDIWLRLANLKEGGSQLGDAASERFRKLSEANPQWKLSPHERDEFVIWSSGTGDPHFESSREIDLAPRKRRELVAWLKRERPEQRPIFYEDTWRQTCGRHPLNSLFALGDLAQEGIWPRDRWRSALSAWSEKSPRRRSWRCVAPLIQDMPENFFRELSLSIALWLRAVSTLKIGDEQLFLRLSERILSLNHSDTQESDDPVTTAINHPIGHITEALLNVWYARNPNDGDTLPEDVAPHFTRLCNTDVIQFRHGRVLLAAHLISLFRVDRYWTTTHLRSVFDWKTDPVEARGAWEGFLWSPRLYSPLLTAFKEHFLSTATHYADLGTHGGQFARFLTFAALDPVEGYTADDFRLAISALPENGLEEVAHALCNALDGAGEQREEYWKNRIRPFWQNIWPKSRDRMSASLAASLALLSIAARGDFPSALSAIFDWLQPVTDAHYPIHVLNESALAKRFPEDTLSLLDALIGDNSWVFDDLRQCLTALSQTTPELVQDRRYRRLDDYLRRRGL